jgi:alkylation response protein AidB-like acyl-CoA dehydrogenase
MAIATDTLLSDELLDECAARTRRYDSENTFFHEDFEALRQAGYLLMAVPEELGGKGYKLNQVC